MTELLQTILLRVTIAGAMSAMALKLAGGGALKEVVRTAAGLLMLLALLQPLAGLHVLSWNWQGSVSQSDIDEMQARNMQTTMSTVAASIAKAVQQRAEVLIIPSVPSYSSPWLQASTTNVGPSWAPTASIMGIFTHEPLARWAK